MNHRLVMGYERSEGADYICNAVIMCEPESEIIREWIEIYNQSWANHIFQVGWAFGSDSRNVTK